ncbi:MAG: gluconate 2-dehydrogenase subunit 3 family protein [Kordiimonadaceae bacterium]|jgi:hypothetical protein|nr:gluconate 2-dehydrogenase subunit 3 family protein [Kordiimonadaceae bacterium]MBT6031083.1 gluconate 2-dehydrogenase subunit 3 family protein [Kordiimonadaceae bacterium]
MSNIYQSKINRRDGLRWMGSLATVVVIGGVTVACESPAPEIIPVDPTSNWPDLKLDLITGPKYGQDPTVSEPTRPWALTMTSDQINLVAQLCDIICPADEGGPSANDVGVPEVIDEWISAPYSSQQQDKVLILNGLQWLDDEAGRRFNKTFFASTDAEQIAIIDDIAYKAQADKPEFTHAVGFFAKLRTLVLGGYFTSPEGVEDIGYQGNVPIMGDYPGPTAEAMAHLEEVIANLPA